MIVSCGIMFSANGCSNTIEMKKFVVKGTILQMKITPIECQNQSAFHYRQNWWISLNKSGNSNHPTSEKTLWFQPSVDYI